MTASTQQRGASTTSINRPERGNRIRIERDSEEVDKIFDQVVTMLREARKSPGEPSYRTVEVEFGTDKVTDD
ncbi:hypothetical protein E8E11_003368 [Didymella keratinophila]|nr:hypothetical protein E8E11_003368 [Didymella keratinophila]